VGDVKGAMADFDLDAYLARIAYDGPRQPSRDALAALHVAHVTAIPFENLDILLGRAVSLDPAALQAKLVGDRRGGYCFEQNALFQAALEAFGFAVTPLAARVRAGMTGVRPRTHMLLRVELPEGAFLADVGFGGDGLIQPLPFAPLAEVFTAGVGHRLRREGELWVLQAHAGEWGDLYAFTLEPQHPVDYEMANHYTSTWPASKFVQTLTAQRSRPWRRSILRNRTLTVRADGAVHTEAIRDADHLLAVLDREFGLSFPPGTRFSRPEF
jgi:N-hydroxyarylamine O-acetyltransferase